MASRTSSARALLLFCFLCGSAFAQPAAPPAVPEPGLLVLRNGQVLEGDISQLGDQYLVALPGRGELRLPSARVDFYCRSLDEAYQTQRGRLAGQDPEAHLELAQWCLHHRLLEQAGEQLEAAQGKRVNQWRLQSLERRLQYLRSAPATSATPAQVAPPAARPDASTSPAVLASPSAEISSEAMERFTSQVQPLLLNRCGNSRCHGITSTSQFRLLRPNWGDTVTYRITQRNLHSTLKVVDFDLPASSRLLTAPREPHGESQVPVFDQHTMDQHDLLAAWIELVTRPESPAAPSTIGRPDGILLQPTSMDWTPAIGTSSFTGETTPRADASAASRAARQESEAAPQDPFDPEVFNRRYHRQGN